MRLCEFISKRVCAILLLSAATAIAVPAQTFTTVANFFGSNGVGPSRMSLTQGMDGKLYGTTAGGGASRLGTVFRVTLGRGEHILQSFAGSPTEGNGPAATLALGTDGNFYGTTAGGGAYGRGTVFKVTPSGTLATLYSFCVQPQLWYCPDGASPSGGLVLATDGNFYGTTSYQEGSTFFKISSDGTLTTLGDCNEYCYEFETYTSLVQATNGNFYGTSYINNGSIFKVTPGGAATTLYTFCAQDLCADGYKPYGGLTLATDGNLYGTTILGGIGICSFQIPGCGTVFKISLDGTLTMLYRFTGAGDGYSPEATLVQGTDGKLYGTTYGGGANNLGTIFSITGDGTLTTLHSFDGGDGATPTDGLFQATNGIFYGATDSGGAYGDGTIFSLDMGLGPFVSFLRDSGKVGCSRVILGQGFTGTTSVSFNGTPATFNIHSDTFLTATVPAGATTGYVTVTTPSGTLTSNVPFQVRP